MKKILFMMTLVNFLIGCNQNQSKDITGKNTVVEKVESSNKNNNIYNKSSMEILEKLKKSLKILYTYSTEKRYDFSYPNKYLGILENNDYVYMSYSKNRICTFIKINLENFQSSIILENNYNERSIEISQEDFSKLIKKLREISISTKFFNSEEKMEIIIFDDIAGKVQNQNVNAKVILEKKGNESDIIFKNLADDGPLFTLDLKLIEILGAKNNSDAINQVINKYSDVLLGKIINLGQKYEQLNYLVKNSKEIVSYLNTESKNFKYVTFLEYNRIREYNLDINYYSSGRIKSIGDYEFENNSNIEKISGDITLLKEDIGEIHTPWQLNNYKENIFDIIYFIQKEELNLNPTEEEKKNLQKLKDEITPIFNKLDKIIENSKNDEKVTVSPGMYGVFYPSGRIKIYGDNEGYLGEFFYEDKPLNYEEIQKDIDEVKKIVELNIKNKTYDNVWQLQEYLYPKLEGYNYSRNLSEKEKSQLKDLRNQVEKINENYKNSF